MDETKLPLTARELTHYTNMWCKSKGITSADLDKHPQADDVVLMLKWREEMWHKLNASEQAVWGAYWNIVYNKKRALYKKALNKLEQITITASDRHLKNLIKTAQQRQRIKALRQNPNSKPADDMTAKDAGLSQTVPWE